MQLACRTCCEYDFWSLKYNKNPDIIKYLMQQKAASPDLVNNQNDKIAITSMNFVWNEFCFCFMPN